MKLITQMDFKDYFSQEIEYFFLDENMELPREEQDDEDKDFGKRVLKWWYNIAWRDMIKKIGK